MAAVMKAAPGLVVLWAWSIGLAQSQTGEDERLRLLHADVARSFEQNGRVVRQLEGHVKFQQGATRMSCERALQHVDEARTEFIGNVVIDDGDRRLQAARVVYYEKLKIQEAFTRVFLRRGKNSLRAEKVTYRQLERRANADQSVELFNSERRVRVNADRAVYWRDDEHSRFYGNPVLVQLDSLGKEIMRVVGDTMEVFEAGKRARVRGNVTITRNKTRAQCGEAEYRADNESLELRLEPVAWQGQDEIRGKSIALFFTDEKLTRAHVEDQAQVVSKVDTASSDDRLNTITGGEITMFFAAEQLQRMVVERTATSFYHVIEAGRNKGKNRAEGDRITLSVKDGNIVRVIVESRPGKSTGKFVPPNLPMDRAASPDTTAGPVSMRAR